MNETWKRTLTRAGLGFLLGLAVAGGFTLLARQAPESFLGTHGSAAAVLYFLYCGVYGAVCFGAQMVYYIESWSIARATFVHFTLALAGFCVLGFSLGWLDVRGVTFRIMLVIYVAAYALIWLAYYLAWRRRVRAMNDELRKWKSTRRPD